MLKYAEIKPAINQVEIHPFLPNTELIKYCRSQDIMPVAYSPLGSQNQVPGTDKTVSTHAELVALAEKKGVTVAQILIAWGLSRGDVVLPKSAKEERIQSNFQPIDLTGEDFKVVDNVAEGNFYQFVNPVDMFGFDVWAVEPR